MTEAVSVAATYSEVSTRASGASVEDSTEAVAVSTAVLVGGSIGHQPCSFWYVFAYVCRILCGFLLSTDLSFNLTRSKTHII